MELWDACRPLLKRREVEMETKINKLPVLPPEKWRGYARGLIRGETIRQGLDYGDLVVRLAEMKASGYDEKTLRRKITRGEFSAAFFLQLMCALERESIDIRHIVRQWEIGGE